MLKTEQLKPKTHDASEKYSLYLYQFIKKWRKENKKSLPKYDVRCYKGLYGTYFLGYVYENNIVFCRQLTHIVHGQMETFAYDESWKVSQWEDVTDKFFAEYLRIGKCAIPFYKDDHNWEFLKNGMTRKCTHCGLTQKLKMEKVETYHKNWEVVNEMD